MDLAAWTPAVVAVTVPYLTYRFALQQERRKWSRERRAEVYVEFLAAMAADRAWIEDQNHGSEAPIKYPIERQGAEATERRQLDAKVAAYASSEVLVLKGKLVEAGFGAMVHVRLPPAEGLGPFSQRQVALFMLGARISELERQIRAELNSDHHWRQWRLVRWWFAKRVQRLASRKPAVVSKSWQ